MYAPEGTPGTHTFGYREQARSYVQTANVIAPDPNLE